MIRLAGITKVYPMGENVTVTALAGIDLSIDEHHVNGRLRLDLRAGPALSFDLRSDHLYLEPSARILAPGGSPVALLLSLPLGFPGKVDARGNLDIGELRVGDLTAKRVEAKVQSVGRLLAVSPLTAQFYDGEARVELVLDRQKEAPVLLVQAILTGFDPGAVVREWPAGHRSQLSPISHRYRPFPG